MAVANAPAKRGPMEVSDFTAQVILLMLTFYFLIWRTRPEPDLREQEEIYKEGYGFLEQIKGTFTLEQIAEMPVVSRESLIEQCGFDVLKINKFIELAASDPKVKAVTVEVHDRWWKEYRVVRQSIRQRGDLDPFN